ncbi:HAD family hydrolase [Chloroflexota bacterium]
MTGIIPCRTSILPPEELQVAACRAFNLEVTPEAIRGGLSAADQFFYEENARSKVEKRPHEEQLEVYSRYEGMILEKAGIEAPKELALAIMMKLRELGKGMTFVLFDDALPTLSKLKGRGLGLGLISNIDRDMVPLCHDLGLAPYLDCVITSQEAGAEKPHPPIFLAALRRVGVEAGEAMYVGDQYNIDVVGARGSGLKALLIDRHDLFPEVTDCPRIRSLAEVEQHL